MEVFFEKKKNLACIYDKSKLEEILPHFVALYRS
jgi:hypothetical protein